MTEMKSTRQQRYLGALIVTFMALAVLALLSAPNDTQAQSGASETNQVVNGTFESGNQPWQCNKCTLSTGAPAHGGSRAAQLRTTSSADRAQFYQAGIRLQPNTQYTLRFWAKSAGGQDFQVHLLKHGSPYTNYGLSTSYLNVTTAWKEFVITFATKGFSQPVADARLRFFAPMGSGFQYSIDDVSLVASGDTSPSPKPSPTPTATPGTNPPPSTGSELVVYDWNQMVTTAQRGFPWEQPPRANGNWMTPINFAEGTFYYRAEIRSMPTNKDMKLQFCIWQAKNNDNFALENCGSQQSISYRGNAVVATWSQGVQNLWKKGGKIIEWDRPRYRNGVAIKTSAGLPVSNFNGWNWNGQNPNHWYPMNLRFTVVVVEKGKSFSGWDNYIK